ncbi:BatA and WFA domain-containing protein [Elusimicrobiota bacterium]
MRFTNPTLLIAGALAAAAVFILHFLYRKRVKEEFSFTNLRLLYAVIEEKAFRKRLKEILVAVFRALMLLAVFSALAGPYGGTRADDEDARSGQAGAARKSLEEHYWMVFDASYSMGYKSAQGVSLLDASKDAAVRLVNEVFDSGAYAFIGVMSFSGSGRAKEILQPTQDRNLLVERIRSVEITHGQTDHGAWAQKLSQIHQGSPVKGIFVFSDMAEHGFDFKNNASGSSGAMPPVIFADASVKDFSNRSLHCSFLDASDELLVSVKCYGENARSANKVYLRNGLTDELILTAAISRCGETRISFQADSAKKRIDDMAIKASIGADSLSIDDRDIFILKRKHENAVVFVDGDPGRRAEGSESYFLREALSAIKGIRADSGDKMPDFKDIYVTQDEFKTIISKHSGFLNGVSEVWLLHPKKMPEGVIRALEVFASDANKKLFVSLGPRADLDSVSQLLDARITEEKSGKGMHLVSGIAGFKNFELNKVRFDKYFGIDPTAEGKTWLGLSRIKGKLCSGEGPAHCLMEESLDPVLYEFAQGGALIFLLTSTIDAEWTNMPLKGLFMSMIERVIRKIPYSLYPRHFFAGESVSVKLQNTMPFSVSVVWPSGRTSRHEARDGNLDFGALEELGVYTMKWPFALSSLEKDIPKFVAVRVPTQGDESDLARVSDSKITEMLGSGTIWQAVSLERVLEEPQSMLELLASKRFNRHFLLLAMVFLTFESLLLLEGRRKKR